MTDKYREVYALRTMTEVRFTLGWLDTYGSAETNYDEFPPVFYALLNDDMLLTFDYGVLSLFITRIKADGGNCSWHVTDKDNTDRMTLEQLLSMSNDEILDWFQTCGVNDEY